MRSVTANQVDLINSFRDDRVDYFIEIKPLNSKQ